MNNKYVSLWFYVFSAAVFFLAGWSFPGLVQAVVSNCSVYSASVPQGYASPANFFSPGEDLVRVFCDHTILAPVQVEAGKTSDATDVAVYHQAWYYTGTQWTPITLSGNLFPNSSQWIIGRGVGTISNPHNGRNYFVAYTCIKNAGTWKCGCTDSACSENKWQLQAFDVNPVGQQIGCSSGGTIYMSRPVSGAPPDTLPQACVGRYYAVHLYCAGRDDFAFVFVDPDDAPPGLKTDNHPDDGPGRSNYIIGTPTQAGAYNFAVIGRGTQNSSCTGKLRLEVKP